jgi:RES domain-containing protein
LLDDGGLRAALPTIALATCSEKWVHVSLYKWRDTLLTATGATETDGRFHLKNEAPALYFAQSPIVALAEVGLLARAQHELKSAARPPQIILNTDITIPQGILDLTVEANRVTLGTELQELTGSWMLERPCATQRLGNLAYISNRVVAIKYPSKTIENHVEANLVVFIDRLAGHAGCSLAPHDPDSDLPTTVHPIIGT